MAAPPFLAPFVVACPGWTSACFTALPALLVVCPADSTLSAATWPPATVADAGRRAFSNHSAGVADGTRLGPWSSPGHHRGSHRADSGFQASSIHSILRHFFTSI